MLSIKVDAIRVEPIKSMFTSEDVSSADGHNNSTNHQISYGQAHYEEIGHLFHTNKQPR